MEILKMFVSVQRTGADEILEVWIGSCDVFWVFPRSM